MSDPKLHDEAGRVAALKRYEILDTPPEAPFERITGLVKAVLDVPMATIPTASGSSHASASKPARQRATFRFAPTRSKNASR